MAGLLQDVRLALRQLRKNLGFTISSVVMLAVAICANSTMLSWINVNDAASNIRDRAMRIDW